MWTPQLADATSVTGVVGQNQAVNECCWSTLSEEAVQAEERMKNDDRVDGLGQCPLSVLSCGSIVCVKLHTDVHGSSYTLTVSELPARCIHIYSVLQLPLSVLSGRPRYSHVCAWQAALLLLYGRLCAVPL